MMENRSILKKKVKGGKSLVKSFALKASRHFQLLMIP
jgi:hypothetical protein